MTPQVYVGTYQKYNQGNLRGKWFDLDDYQDKEEFIAAALDLHSDEIDPELMFQDWSDMPKWAFSESYIDDRLWDYLDQVEPENREAFNAYTAHQWGDRIDDLDQVIQEFEDRYQGEYRNELEFAEQLIEDIGVENLINPENYFDQDSFVRDLEYEGWTVVDETDANDYPDDYPDGPGIYDPSGMYYASYDDLDEMVDGWLNEEMISKENMLNYFDTEKFARDLFLSGDYFMADGHVFSGH